MAEKADICLPNDLSLVIKTLKTPACQEIISILFNSLKNKWHDRDLPFSCRASINCLTGELLQIIISMCDVITLARLAKCSKRLNCLVNNSLL